MQFAFLVFIFSACSSVPSLETKPLHSEMSESPFKQKDAATLAKEIEDAPTLIWPLNDGVVTQEFKQKKGRKRAHHGVDIAAPKGDEVYAAHDGLVIFSGRRFRGFGKLIIIENDNGKWATFYSHLLKINIHQGQRVSQGQVIGKVGKTGRATGYHLHFEVRHDKQPINPLTVLP